MRGGMRGRCGGIGLRDDIHAASLTTPSAARTCPRPRKIHARSHHTSRKLASLSAKVTLICKRNSPACGGYGRRSWSLASACGSSARGAWVRCAARQPHHAPHLPPRHPKIPRIKYLPLSLLQRSFASGAPHAPSPCGQPLRGWLTGLTAVGRFRCRGVRAVVAPSAPAPG